MRSVSYRQQLKRDGVELSVDTHGGVHTKNVSVSEQEKV